MRNIQTAVTVLFLFLFFNAFAQNPAAKKIKLTGKVVEKTTQQPLEYATVTLFAPQSTKPITGGITNPKGEFDMDVIPGTYDIKIEFISFRPTNFTARTIADDTNLGVVELSDAVTALDEVVVRAEKTTVEIKLDKKVYNVGNDLMVKGGTVSDVLDNIPSVAVDAEGVVSLRGNENVRILIDGRPSNAINIAEALRLIPADAIDKVEVITNPSARYDSEGGGGLLNIILKKGKNQGINGTFIASAGHPESYGISGNINYKTEEFNLYTNTGFNHRTNPGRSITNSEYLNDNGAIENIINESRENERVNNSFNSELGLEWYLDKSTTWTNEISLRKSNSNNRETVTLQNLDPAGNYLFTNYRNSQQDGDGVDVEFSTNLVKKFKKEGHELSIDAAFAEEQNHDFADINLGIESTRNDQNQQSNEIEVDYVLPLGEDSQFEAGYNGGFNKQTTDYTVSFFYPPANQLVADPTYSNVLEYNENINAIYTQYGSKIGKFSYLLGLRWEDTNIDINQLTTQDFNNKHYSNFFPSAFLTYEFSDEGNISLSYSRRISRPRGRQINPFPNRSSNINIFRGNPDLDAAFSDAFDLGYLKRWTKLTLSTSLYVNRTTDAFQFIRRESGEFVTTLVDGADTVDNEGNPVIVGGADILTPVILSTPINLATEYRMGFEFTLNYTPFKWWKLNSNFNFFRNETQGDYTYIDFQNNTVTQNFDNTAFSWFTRLTSKVSLPYKIDWQTNITYNGPQTNAQGRSLGVAAANLAFSKDLFKEKATVTLNVQDVFNSRKRINETQLEKLNSYSEMQWRVRSVNLSFTYRFNKKKERERPQRENENGNDDFQG